MAQIGTISFTPEEFPVNLYQYHHMVLVDNPESIHLDTYYTFKGNGSDYQIRYTFFKQTNKDDPNIKTQYAVMLVPIIWNVAGRQITNIRNFEDIEVQMAFNGDFGSTILIEYPDSDFVMGFNYIILNFFYKLNQGFIVQSILSNDPEFFTFRNKIFSDIFHSFKFMD